MSAFTTFALRTLRDAVPAENRFSTKAGLAGRSEYVRISRSLRHVGVKERLSNF